MRWRSAARTAGLLVAGSLLAAAALALAIGGSGQFWGLVLGIGVLGFAFFLAGATRLAPPVLNWGLGVILAALVAGVGFSPQALSPAVLLEGACLYAAAELAWLAAGPRQLLAPAPLLLRGLVLLGGLGIGYLALFGRVLPYAGGPLITVLGVAAAILVFFLLRGRGRGRAAPRGETRP